jgi:hypothetical protein
MRKTILLVAACVMSMLASAQIFEVQSVQELPGASFEMGRVAAVSPAGDYILMTMQGGIGLQRYDVATGQLTKISEAPGAAVKLQLSQDGKEIAFQELSMNADKSITSNVKKMNMVSNETTTVAKNLSKIDKAYVATSAATPVLTNEEGMLYLTKNGKKILIAPIGLDYIYIWASLSPDQTKICYYVGERGCFVCDLKGENNQFIGFHCTAAQWYDNNTLVSMRAEDDGHHFTSSVLEAYTLDGKRQTLTDKSIMASYPYAIDGKIVFTDLEKGTAYMMTVK